MLTVLQKREARIGPADVGKQHGPAGLSWRPFIADVPP
jgi:hypothetical protein